jgi:LSD1 subclass zinc finger protein
LSSFYTYQSALCPHLIPLFFPSPSPPHSTTTFSHATTVVQCSGCQTVIAYPTGGKAKVASGCSFRVKAE